MCNRLYKVIEELSGVNDVNENYKLRLILEKLEDEMNNIIILMHTLDNVVAGYERCENEIMKKVDLNEKKISKNFTGVIDLENISTIMKVFDKGWKK